ncbi:MAG: hypothetical protein ACRC62_16525 [Microcoleus sp.]
MFSTLFIKLTAIILYSLVSRGANDRPSTDSFNRPTISADS